MTVSPFLFSQLHLAVAIDRLIASLLAQWVFSPTSFTFNTPAWHFASLLVAPTFSHLTCKLVYDYLLHAQVFGNLVEK